MDFSDFIDQTTNQLVEKIIKRLIEREELSLVSALFLMKYLAQFSNVLMYTFNVNTMLNTLKLFSSIYTLISKMCWEVVTAGF